MGLQSRRYGAFPSVARRTTHSLAIEDRQCRLGPVVIVSNHADMMVCADESLVMPVRLTGRPN